MLKKVIVTLLFVTIVVSQSLIAQDKKNFGEIHGNFQSDFQYYLRDTLIDPTGEAYPDERLLGTGFLNLTYTKDNFMAGIRYENYQNNRVGLPSGYKGQGITYRYARYVKDGFDFTVGNFYEQFGTGMILRAYEERGLGLDNNLDGLRMIYTPTDGLVFKILTGRQRNYFDISNSIVRGFDAEWSLKNTLNWEGNTNLILGAGVVSKYQEFDDPTYVYPKNVAAGSFRANLITGSFNILGEFAYKANDPSADNFAIYKPGTAGYLTASYAKGKFGLLLNLKHYDNFSFRSEPATDPQQLLIGYLPSATTLHTYALPALYSYNTVLTGEQGFQIEGSYKIPRNSFLGGKYGMITTVSFAASQSLKKDYITRDIYNQSNDSIIGETISGTDGYKTKLGLGDHLYFTDLHIELKRKISKKVKLTGTYYNFFFNEDALRKGVAGVSDISIDTGNVKVHEYYVNAGVLEILWKIKSGHSLRTEIQTLFTEGDRGNWGLLLLEYSIAPKWFFAVQDAYNYGNPNQDLQIHYISVNGGYTLGTTKFQLGYGRQQEGVFCVGGICRVVPASNGFTFGVTTNF